MARLDNSVPCQGRIVVRDGHRILKKWVLRTARCSRYEAQGSAVFFASWRETFVLRMDIRSFSIVDEQKAVTIVFSPLEAYK
jgi:hypothetical protein